MELIKRFVSNAGVGFWLSLGASVLSLITGIVYAAAYNGSNYMSWAAFAMFVLAFVAFVALSLFGVTYRFAPAVGGVLDLIAMCLYIGAVYMYLSEVFYGGITAAAMAELDPAFVFCLVASVVCIGLFIAGIFVRQRRRVKSVTAAEDGGESAETPTAEEAAELSDYDRAYAALSDDVRAFADKVIAHALSLDGAAEKRSNTKLTVRAQGSSVLTVRISRGVAEAHFKLENDAIRAIRTESGLPLKDTVVRITDDRSAEAACRIIDVMYERRVREIEDAKQRRRRSRAKSDRISEDTNEEGNR